MFFFYKYFFIQKKSLYLKKIISSILKSNLKTTSIYRKEAKILWQLFTNPKTHYL